MQNDRDTFGVMPEGFGMALAQNIYAMEHFAGLPDAERRAVILRARSVSSQNEMQELVNGLIRH